MCILYIIGPNILYEAPSVWCDFQFPILGQSDCSSDSFFIIFMFLYVYSLVCGSYDMRESWLAYGASLLTSRWRGGDGKCLWTIDTKRRLAPAVMSFSTRLTNLDSQLWTFIFYSDESIIWSSSWTTISELTSTFSIHCFLVLSPCDNTQIGFGIKTLNLVVVGSGFIWLIVIGQVVIGIGWKDTSDDVSDSRLLKLRVVRFVAPQWAPNCGAK